MVAKYDHNNNAFVQKVLSKRAATLYKQLTSLNRGPDEEAIHDTRVASRRMRAALEAFEDLFPSRSWKPVKEYVRKITRLLGRTRESQVNLGLLREFPDDGDLAENMCREYLLERLGGRLRKERRRLKRRMPVADPNLLKLRINSLMSELATDRSDSPSPGLAASSQRGRRRISRFRFLQQNLFPLQDTPRERGERVLSSMAQPLLNFNAQDGFQRATEEELHELRIVAKKLRYAMEIFDPVWTRRLKEEIALARALQDAGGRFHDWCMLRNRIQKEIARLTAGKTGHLAFQMGRLLAKVEERVDALREGMLPPLSRLQESLRILLPQQPSRQVRKEEDALPSQSMQQ